MKQKRRVAFATLVFLSHFQGELFAAQDVEVQVLDRLTGIGAAVGDHPVAVYQTFCPGDFGNFGRYRRDTGSYFSVLYEIQGRKGSCGVRRSCACTRSVDLSDTFVDLHHPYGSCELQHRNAHVGGDPFSHSLRNQNTVCFDISFCAFGRRYYRDLSF